MEASSKSAVNTSLKHEIEIKPIGFPTRLPSFFKEEITNGLNKKNRHLYIKFDSLTRVNFESALREGCRVLQLNCQIVSTEEDCIIAEDLSGRADKIYHTEIIEIFESLKPPVENSVLSPIAQHDQGIDVIVLGSRNDRRSAAFFANLLHIPHVITFEFLQQEPNFLHKLYEDECIGKFSQYFYEELIGGISVKEAHKNAWLQTLDYLSQSFFDLQDNAIIQGIIGDGPLLLPSDKEHEQILFSQKNRLTEGKIEDISKARVPTNVEKLITPFTGRNNDIFAIAKLLLTLNFQAVKISGEAGVGKTAFAMQLVEFFFSKNAFKDGIFYFGLKMLEGESLLYAMKDMFGPKFENIKGFFRGKNMLLIFDDFDLFYSKKCTFSRVIFLALKECEVKIVALVDDTRTLPIQKKIKRAEASNKKVSDYNAKKHSIESEFLKTERVLKPLQDFEMAHILQSLIVSDFHSNYTISQITKLPPVISSKGYPRPLIEQLSKGKINIDKKPLQLKPSYRRQLDLDDLILSTGLIHSASSPKRPAISVSRHSGVVSMENNRPIRSLSSLKPEDGRFSINIKDIASPFYTEKKTNYVGAQQALAYPSQHQAAIQERISTPTQYHQHKERYSPHLRVPSISRYNSISSPSSGIKAVIERSGDRFLEGREDAAESSDQGQAFAHSFSDLEMNKQKSMRSKKPYEEKLDVRGTTSIIRENLVEVKHDKQKEQLQNLHAINPSVSDQGSHEAGPCENRQTSIGINSRSVDMQFYSEGEGPAKQDDYDSSENNYNSVEEVYAEDEDDSSESSDTTSIKDFSKTENLKEKIFKGRANIKRSTFRKKSRFIVGDQSARKKNELSDNCED